MSKDILTKYENKLKETKVGWGNSAESEARGINRGEALNIIMSWKQEGLIAPDKNEELLTRIHTLKSNSTFGVSPFNSPFYVSDVCYVHKNVYVRIRGQGTMKEILLRFVNYLLKELYKAELTSNPDNNHIALVRSDSGYVGDAFYVGRYQNPLVIRLKNLHRRLTVRIRRTDAWTIETKISFSNYTDVRTTLPLLEKLKEKYEQLLQLS